MSEALARASAYLPVLLEGVWVTIAVTVLSLLVSTVLGLFWAILGWTKVPAFRAISRTFITVIRGIPIIVQLFYIYFVMPDIGINMTAFQAGVIGMGIAYSAYQAENFRAGIEAIDRGQIEAAQSIGMSDSLIMRRVILPQAFRIALPPYGNTMIMMLKDSSLVSTITVAELTRQGQLIAASTFDNMTVFTLVAIIYLIMALPLTYLARQLERRYKKT
ncbi:ectoine/hydroxyectoine ABC transporter permease EhuD [Nitratireductor indicus C115]|uniref:Putative glutamine transport system permease protein GlnP n=1 Tax=Nitratireductor indicus C115 TaxID=1231190 RepID=K2N5W9_9HYPH|nr:amino acid ABC transporter permease [Nitratireductor indicus]EKF42863.1 ectoine/hydroxyectoine ABC transporter permease EhuD [Nitratireductor indicus C115]SFQ41450.1 polar amino acid transport system permease protein [Nitratireductor indicus]